MATRSLHLAPTAQPGCVSAGGAEAPARRNRRLRPEETRVALGSYRTKTHRSAWSGPRVFVGEERKKKKREVSGNGEAGSPAVPPPRSPGPAGRLPVCGAGSAARGKFARRQSAAELTTESGERAAPLDRPAHRGKRRPVRIPGKAERQPRCKRGGEICRSLPVLSRYSQLSDGALGDHGVVGKVGDHRGSPRRRPPCPAASGAAAAALPRGSAALRPPPRPLRRSGPGSGAGPGQAPPTARTWRRRGRERRERQAGFDRSGTGIRSLVPAGGREEGEGGRWRAWVR